MSVGVQERKSVGVWEYGSVGAERTRWVRLLMLLWVLLANVHEASAGTRRKPTLKLSLRASRVRSNAPILARAKFEWTGTRLLEGRLELVLKAGQEILTRYRSPELALTSGEQAVDFLLPAVSTDAYDGQINVFSQFLTKGKTFTFEPTLWSVPTSLERSCVIGVSADAVDRQASYGRIANALALETFQPKPKEGARRTLTTWRARLTPDELPTHPLGYCSFDLLLLTGKGFTFLNQRQLDAIACWVKAGGSVCVVPAGALDARHVRFLNKLTEQDTPVFGLDGEGQLKVDVRPRAGKTKGIHTFYTGLGRTAIVLAPPESADDLNSSQWRATRAFLWKIRAQQLPAVIKAGEWRTDLQRPELRRAWIAGRTGRPMPRVWSGMGPNVPPLESSLHVLPIYNLDQIIGGLMPREVRLIPFSMVVLILALFVVAVGPLDYYLLGLLRLRKFTWLLFPLTAAAFAFFTVQLAEYYMGRRDHRRSIVIVDVDRQGQPVRQSRYEFLFAGSERTTDHKLRNCLFYAMGQSAMGYEQAWQGAPRPRLRQREFPAAEAQPLAYQGRLPRGYTATQRIRQWTPLLNKRFSLDPPPDMPEVKWDAVGVSDFQAHTARTEVPYKLFGTRRTHRAVLALNGLRCHEWGGHDRAWAFLTKERGSRGLIQRASVRPQEGLFSIVSQISPAGAPNFEDVALLDPTDPSQWLLLVIEKKGDDIYIYRCLYRAESEPGQEAEAAAKAAGEPVRSHPASSRWDGDAE